MDFVLLLQLLFLRKKQRSVKVLKYAVLQNNPLFRMAPLFPNDTVPGCIITLCDCISPACSLQPCCLRTRPLPALSAFGSNTVRQGKAEQLDLSHTVIGVSAFT